MSLTKRHARSIRRGIEHGRILGARAGAIPSERSYPFRGISRPTPYQRAVMRAWEATWWDTWGSARVWDGSGHPSPSNYPDIEGIRHIRHCAECRVNFPSWSGFVLPRP